MICALLLCVEAVLPACTGTTAPACRYEFSSAPPGSFGSADFSPDGLLIATSAGWLSDPVVRSTQDGSVVAVLPAEGPKKSVLFSPNGQDHKDLKEDICVFSGFLEILTLCVFFLQDFSRS